MKERLNKTVKKYVIVLLCGAAYALFVYFTGWGIPCPINLITGLECPACGVSRMLMAMIRFDFISAFYYNPFLFVTSPVLLFCIVYPDIAYIKTGSVEIGRMKIVLWLEVVAALAFGVMRNLP